MATTTIELSNGQYLHWSPGTTSGVVSDSPYRLDPAQDPSARYVTGTIRAACAVTAVPGEPEVAVGVLRAVAAELRNPNGNGPDLARLTDEFATMIAVANGGLCFNGPCGECDPLTRARCHGERG